MEAIHEWGYQEQACEWEGCTKTTKGPKRMSDHVRRAHKISPGPFHKCGACAKVFMTIYAKRAHEKAKHK